MGQFVTLLRPETKLIVAMILPIEDGVEGHAPFVDSYNQAVRGFVAKYRVSHQVSIVDLNTEFPTEGLSEDKLHPSDIGYRWMAERWREAILETTRATADTSGR